MTTHRAFGFLFFVLFLIVGFCTFSITFSLVAPEAGTFPVPDPWTTPLCAPPWLPLALLGLLWLAYHLWKNSMERQEDLDDVLSSLHPVVLLVVSPDRTIRLCTPALTRVFGYRVGEVLHRKTDLLYQDRRSGPHTRKEVYEALEQHGFHVGTARGIRKDGETFPLEIISGSLSGRQGAVLLLRDITERKQAEDEMESRREELEALVRKRTDRLVVTMDDLLREISERKQAEETVRKLNQELEQRVNERTRELQTAYEDLKQVDRLKDDFLSTVSHEFRTPLTSIMSFSEILLDFPEESAETKHEFYSIIYHESQRLSRLINDLLDLSKIQAGKMEWRCQKVEAAGVVDRALQSVLSLASKKGVRLLRDVGPGLPTFYGDEDRILQVLINLMGNAIKFTPEGGSVRVRAEREDPGPGDGAGPRLHFSVQDTGQGIRPEDLERIFERFAQGAHESAQKPGGTGLGLSICRKIVSAHRGDIWAESEVGAGSIFHATFPLDRRENAPALLSA
jgi:PAS domain S-box-containing protein